MTPPRRSSPPPLPSSGGQRRSDPGPTEQATFQPPAPEVAVYVISVAAELSGLHPQTLRAYERLGLISPGRTMGGGRRYSHRDIEKLRSIAELTAAGVGVEGVRRLVELGHQLEALQLRNAELVAELEATRQALRTALAAGPPADRLPVLRPPDPGQSVVVWRRGR